MSISIKSNIMAMIGKCGAGSDGGRVEKANWGKPVDHLEFDVLTEINNSGRPIGASVLASKIQSSQATIGRKLNELEARKLLVKMSNKGRVLSEEGKKYYAKLKNDFTSAVTIQQLLDESNRSTPKRLLDTLAVRRILETEIAVQATRSITREELKELEKILSIQAEKVAQGFLGDEEDLLFHRRLAAISRNEVLEQIITIILTQNRAYSGFSFIRKHLPSAVVTDHKRILKAIGAGNEKLAGKLMVKHIDNILSDVKNYFHLK